MPKIKSPNPNPNRIIKYVIKMDEKFSFLQKNHGVPLAKSKGQLILKCPFGTFKSSKKPTKCFPGFMPQPPKRGQIKK